MKFDDYEKIYVSTYTEFAELVRSLLEAAIEETEEQLQSLTDGYKDYVTAPGVSVVVKEIHSRKVFVTGEVAHPGTFDLEPRMKVMQALALAGGLTPYAKGRVVVLRDNRDGREDKRYEIDINDIVKGKKPQDNLSLVPGDTLIVP